MNFLYISKRNPFWIGLVIRLVLAWLLPLLLDNGPVPYTDIDYHVFMDASEYIKNGFSPYDRHTYRYTPFLAKLLSLSLFREAGRYLFCVADALCGSLIIRLRQQSRSDSKKEQEISLSDCLWWMYSPLAINICTRGSAESLMVLLPVLLTIQMVVMIPKTAGEMSTTLLRSSAAGILHGIAIHSKLYPIIYTLSFMAYWTQRGDYKQKPTSIVSFLQIWIRRLLQPAPLLFGVTSLFTFIILTYLAVLQYGQVALDEGLLYHLSRVDHRHNYSIFWYSIYLGRAQVMIVTNMNVVGRLLLVPQFLLLVVSSLGLAPYDLGLALFVQTYLFVTLNKVITAQYFTWYLCLLPLCSRFDYARVRFEFILLGLSILFWLASAYCLEMQGWAVHRVVWVASLLFFGANINLLRALLRSSRKTEGGIKQD